jgi:mono/diheme cytochrome c family protein
MKGNPGFSDGEDPLMMTDLARSFHSHHRRIWPVLLGLAAALTPCLAAADGPTGEQIYQKRCASCHGPEGEGSEENYPQPLVGERSLAQLTRYISKRMPEDDPGTCVGEEAEKVAAYIYEAFYSREAQARNQSKLPRIELSRLTVRQYRNAVADLIGSFRAAPGRWDEQRGLKGEYFKSKRFQTRNRFLERVDSTVHFDFGQTKPGLTPEPPEKAAIKWQRLPAGWFPVDMIRELTQKEFGIRWNGSVFAPETGEYEFIVKTENGARLWVNDINKPLIDAGVKSGNDTVYRETIRLLGGRVYPLRLEFSRSKGEKTASIALEWKPPQRPSELIPQPYLSPLKDFPTTFVVTTPFPADDRSMGYERGTSISKAWDQATTDAAFEVAGYVLAHLRELSGVSDSAADRVAPLRAFCQKFAERAFRRPLSDEQKQRFIDRQFEKAHDPEMAVKRVVLLVLKSPRFLYREVQGGQDPYDIASRLSFSLWDSLPDEELLKAAAAGQLGTREQVARQAERMVNDPRTRAKLRDFFFQWMKVDPPPDLSKDPKQFPEFNEAIASDLRTSLDLLLHDIVWSDASDFRQLLLADYLYLNGRLAQFYGADLPAGAPFQKVKLEPRERAGVVTHPYLLASFAYTATSSPIHRGVFLARNVLGRTLRPPPEAFAPLAPDLHPNLNTRERVTLQTSPEFCAKCHGLINPLGYTLEHFDAVGRYRDQENGRPIDATGTYETRAGDLVKFDGARAIAQFLADSEETHAAFVERLFHYLVKQPIRAFGVRKGLDLRRFFVEHEFNIRALAVEIATASAWDGPHRQPPTLSRAADSTPRGAAASKAN